MSIFDKLVDSNRPVLTNGTCNESQLMPSAMTEPTDDKPSVCLWYCESCKTAIEVVGHDDPFKALHPKSEKFWLTTEY